MAQDYDKIIKENIEDIILPLVHRVLNIYPKRLEEIPDDLQRTIERRPDFLKKVLTEKPEDSYILHIEFQTEDEENMLYRMLEYYAMLMRKYDMDVKQYVFFLKPKISTMPTSLERTNLSFRFWLINLYEQDYRPFLESEIPEEVILAILTNFHRKESKKIIKAILQRVLSLPTETLRKQKCVKQLEVLANLRKLQPEIIKQLSTMPFVYNIKEDLRYQQGVQETTEALLQQFAQREAELLKAKQEELETELRKAKRKEAKLLKAKELELRKQQEAKELELRKQQEAKELELRKQQEAKELELRKQQEAITLLKTKENAIRMHQSGLSSEKIAEFLDVSVEWLRTVIS